ncbi:MAG: hypothetical protein AAAB35_13750 [Phyllobacterium sp.]|uniref:hypothetical protein n=1 Tax=Phyllobacterium sp. TaxID=1871046 RepID=UPI0030EFB5B1
MTEHFKHPQRYPIHPGEKGTVYGGVWTRCDTAPANYFNIHTRGYYCRECAAGINWNPKEPLVCVPVKAGLDRDEMV